MTAEQLEALSLDELYSLADRTGLDLPPGLERLFVIEEILDTLEEDSEDRRESRGDAVHVDEKKYFGLSAGDYDLDPGPGEVLAKRYNETMIRAIARDPSWAFAYWDVSDADLESMRGDESSAGLFLRVAELGSAEPRGSAAESRNPADEAHKDFFDIPVADLDSQWYINLPRSGVRFRIDLCARRGGPAGKIKVLARSNEVESPRQGIASPPESLSAEARELLALSGVEDLSFYPEGDSNPLRLLPSGFARPSNRAD